MPCPLRISAVWQQNWCHKNKRLPHYWSRRYIFWVFSYRSDHSGQSFRLGCGCCSSVRLIPFDPRLSVFRLRLRLSSSARPTGRTLHLQLCPLPPSRYSAFPQAACRYRAPICDPGGIFSFTLPKCRSVPPIASKIICIANPPCLIPAVILL